MKKSLVIIAAVLILALAGFLIFKACSSSDGGATQDSATKVEYVSIDTPYATLKVTESFDENVSHEVTKESPYVLTFSAKKDNTALFSLHFDDPTGNLLGTLQTDDGYYVMYADFAELDQKSPNYQEYSGYQMEVSNITEQLGKDYTFYESEVVKEEDNSSFDVKTKIVTLKYPKKFEKRVKVNVTDEKAEFTCDNVKLFDIVFSTNEGDLLGTYKGTPISIVSYELDKKKLSSSQYKEMTEMQGSINYIIDKLSADSNFVMNK